MKKFMFVLGLTTSALWFGFSIAVAFFEYIPETWFIALAFALLSVHFVPGLFKKK